jgi:flagellar capping protein FliD
MADAGYLMRRLASEISILRQANAALATAAKMALKPLSSFTKDCPSATAMVKARAVLAMAIKQSEARSC